jgi:hypothetical protein
MGKARFGINPASSFAMNCVAAVHLSSLTGAKFLTNPGSSSIFSAPFSADSLPNQTPVEKSRRNGTASTGDFLFVLINTVKNAITKVSITHRREGGIEL